MNHNANVHNPTSSEYKAAAANRVNQMNPNKPAHRASRKKQVDYFLPSPETGDSCAPE